MPKSTRRQFVVGCSAAIAGMSGARFGNLLFADPDTPTSNETLVVIFARGGLDALNLVFPLSGADRGYYEAARPEIAVPVGEALSLNGQLGIHPAIGPLHQIYQSGKLAVIPACGMTEANRSHFDAMKFMELGTPGDNQTDTGWLTRHFASAFNLPLEIVMPAISVGSLQTTSLQGDHDAVNMSDPDDFNLQVGPWEWRDAQRVAMRNLYSSDSTWLHTSATQALDAMDIIELHASGGYTPANGADYPNTSFGRHLETVAQMIKLDLGLRVATVDIGGWDTHNSQGNGSGGYFAGRIAELAEGMAALFTDLNGSGSNASINTTTVVMQSEFGRRLRENADRGTDHGHGGLMMVMGGNAVGGVHGQWPGLANEELFDGADLAVTTDFRRVLSDILIRRMGNNSLGVIFPGYGGYQPLGVVEGLDFPPDYSPAGSGIFRDGFDSGDVSIWSTSQG
jgi:uncharacterized protein (DUF1501 family)